MSGRQQAPNPRRQALVEELSRGREAILQACWAHQHFSPGRLRTTDGRPVEVLFPGWLNRAKGPDFTEARILLDGHETWGDIEIHLAESDWKHHGHQQDPTYQRVMLHVVLELSQARATSPVDGMALPTLHLAPILRPSMEPILRDPEKMLDHYTHLPGRCGLRAAMTDARSVERVLGAAAEKRARDKAARISPGALREESGQGLYHQLFHYLGMKAHAGPFAELATIFPMEALQQLLDQPMEQARDGVLARWFGAMGLLDAPAETANASGRETEYRKWQVIWESLPNQPRVTPFKAGPARPWNTPERRLVGLFHHLWVCARGGWMTNWLRYLHRLDGIRDAPQFSREAMRTLEDCFPSPGDEPWVNLLGFHKPPQGKGARFIGSDRVVILMANAVLPYFLAWARGRGDVELEKVLYRLHLVLPPEGENQRTRFMQQRLALTFPIRKSLRSHQGLLQIHQDFCKAFDQGCDRCTLPDFLAPQLPPSNAPA